MALVTNLGSSSEPLREALTGADAPPIDANRARSSGEPIDVSRASSGPPVTAGSPPVPEEPCSIDRGASGSLTASDLVSSFRTIGDNTAKAFRRPQNLPWGMVCRMMLSGFFLGALASVGIFAWLIPVFEVCYGVVLAQRPDVEGAEASDVAQPGLSRSGLAHASDNVGVVWRGDMELLNWAWGVPFYLCVVTTLGQSIVAILYSVRAVPRAKVLVPMLGGAALAALLGHHFVVKATNYSSLYFLIVAPCVGVVLGVRASSASESEPAIPADVIPRIASDFASAPAHEGIARAGEVVCSPRGDQTTSPTRPKTLTRGVAFGRGILVCVSIWVPGYMFWLGDIVVRIDSDFSRALVVLLVWPAIRELAYAALRSFMRSAFRGDAQARHAIYFAFGLYNTMVTRFILSSMRSLHGLLIATVLQAIWELTLRQSVDARDRFCAGVVAKVTGKSFQDGLAWYRAYGAVEENRAQVLVTEIVTEYAGILLAPLLKLGFSGPRYLYNLGYSGLNPVDAAPLLFGFVIQIALEVMVDVCCCWVEQEMLQLDVRGVWRAQKFRTTLLHGYHFSVGLTIMCLFIGAFVAQPQGRPGCHLVWKPELGEGVVEIPVCADACLESLQSSVFDEICRRKSVTWPRWSFGDQGFSVGDV